jgi:hypothetical protein
VKVGRWVGVGVVLVLIWAGLAYCTGPADAHEYRRTAVQAAQAGLNAVRTAALAGVADRDGKLIDPYLSVLLDQSAGAVASAQNQLGAQSPPDGATRAMRDQLAPLLLDAAGAVGDLDLATTASDDAGIDAVVARLRQLGDRFDDFVDRYR